MILTLLVCNKRKKLRLDNLYTNGFVDADPAYFEQTEIPLLGICFGSQSIAWRLDPENVIRSDHREYGSAVNQPSPSKCYHFCNELTLAIYYRKSRFIEFLLEWISSWMALVTVCKVHITLFAVKRDILTNILQCGCHTLIN